MAQVVAAIPDLFFRAKVLEVAKALAIDVAVARDAAELVERVRADKPRLVLIDLQAQAVEPLKTLAALGGTQVIGFLAHAETALRDQALAAGCAEVLTRGQLSASLPAILRRVL
ncbi:MAG TPA: hypothetical protein VJS92_03105 [Candidatus Polarisedimenticolaceae bacterium]|nr:hypothetical protein [Candidatus Polarisedimenticolaceae bacterium]